MHDERRRSGLSGWRIGALASIVVLGVAAIFGSGGGGGGCALAPGPCPGDFPSEPAQPTATPSDVVIQVGGSATFTAVAPGIAVPSYQWLRTSKGGATARMGGATPRPSRRPARN